ncbi:hypothetical protein C8R43DRAFT_1124763 [Mycena crocata]|nr:hypothetical protein C8R43DRAFT_1124763 [Mycena crocata]
MSSEPHTPSHIPIPSRFEQPMLGSSPGRSPSPGSRVDHPLLITSSPERASFLASRSSQARDTDRITVLSENDCPLSSATRSVPRSASSLYNRNIIRGPPSVILSSKSYSQRASPYSRESSSTFSWYEDLRRRNGTSTLSATHSVVSTQSTTVGHAEYTLAELDVRHRERRVARDAQEVAVACAALRPRTMANMSAGATRIRSATERACITDGWRAAPFIRLWSQPLLCMHPTLARASIQLPHLPHSYAHPALPQLDFDAGIKLDFPGRKDTSVVDYSWDGLRFPKRLVALEPLE